MPALNPRPLLTIGLIVTGLVGASCARAPRERPEGQDRAFCDGLPCFEAPSRCDPSGRAPCEDVLFRCGVDESSARCTQEGSALPGEGDWGCVEAAQIITCVGDHWPEGGEWICLENRDGEIHCRRQAYWPDLLPDALWDCAFEGPTRVCNSRDGSAPPPDIVDDGVEPGCIDCHPADECPPGIDLPTDEVCGDGVDNNCNGVVDEYCPPWDMDCLCTPGAWRYCDTQDYCLWGRQFCAEDGMSWGPCFELIDIPLACAGGDQWYSPTAEICCIEQGRCCQDMWDLDMDGDSWESLPAGCPETACLADE